MCGTAVLAVGAEGLDGLPERPRHRAATPGLRGRTKTEDE
ncbi:hypothetical protein STRIP9103_08485 [Streptomyces ipomoeae 91-03]|uniref:Uncharacterized protein n=1 Tax=Streptomyces ipomoeae 91-03 TaxID=698759 RepID=L1KVQ7_9ACTN|nr:hypothetical protein STRIP9103_08485 [Streptomyces ipomoeae 91-03]